MKCISHSVSLLLFSLISFNFSSVAYRHVSTELRLHTHFTDHVICRNKWNNFVILYSSLQKIHTSPRSPLNPSTPFKKDEKEI